MRMVTIDRSLDLIMARFNHAGEPSKREEEDAEQNYRDPASHAQRFALAASRLSTTHCIS